MRNKWVWGLTGMIALGVAVIFHDVAEGGLAAAAVILCVLIAMVGLVGFIVLRFLESLARAREATQELRGIFRGLGDDDKRGE